MAGEPVNPPVGYRLMKNQRSAKVLIIIPAYQEEDNIPRVLEDIRAHLPEADILVINDGSTDRTAARARQAGVKVIDLPFNLGIGAAVQTGFQYAAAHRYTAAIQIDADYQHPAEEAPRLLKTLEDEKADLVIGSRFIAPTGYRGSWLRRLGNLIFQGANALIVGQRIVDNTSGFRAYSERAIAILAQNYLGEYPEPESISYLDASGCRLVEIPVKMRSRSAGASSITPFKSIYYMVRVLISILSFKKRRRR
jgi:glycosyltransferase involved in cell wall biosynthesis